jgi:NAD(P)-dependent dehydrogenase (short-subunit alcohol dehydrogenase family)
MFLKNRTALITGSTSGIGLGYARALAAEGANVVLNGFGDAAAIEQTRAELAASAGVEVAYSPADMTRRPSGASARWTSSSTTPVSSTSRRSRNSRSRNGTRSSRST